jgi:hypothetical protein
MQPVSLNQKHGTFNDLKSLYMKKVSQEKNSYEEAISYEANRIIKEDSLMRISDPN